MIPQGIKTRGAGIGYSAPGAGGKVSDADRGSQLLVKKQ